ncbi:MAG: CopG family transcriptional regulator [Massilia sp.]|nr:CopG family transcriptional regulator [Massilia sp.]
MKNLELDAGMALTAERCYPSSTLIPIRPATMSTTSLKLSDELKQRAANAAQELGITPHAFMVDAIRRAADHAEQRAVFVAQAQAARAEMLQSGEGIDDRTAREYLRQRVDGKQTGKPGTTSWQK